MEGIRAAVNGTYFFSGQIVYYITMLVGTSHQYFVRKCFVGVFIEEFEMCDIIVIIIPLGCAYLPIGL